MKFDNEAKHVVPKVEDLRTRVQSPPPPPDYVIYLIFDKKYFIAILVPEKNLESKYS